MVGVFMIPSSILKFSFPKSIANMVHAQSLSPVSIFYSSKGKQHKQTTSFVYVYTFSPLLNLNLFMDHNCA